ncbi:MAG: FISUMP domain-containing protein [Candidatus Falkowbacteria bacterium]
MKKILFLLALASIAAGAFFVLMNAQAARAVDIKQTVKNVLPVAVNGDKAGQVIGKASLAKQAKARPRVAGIKITASANDNLASVKATDAVLQNLSSLRTQGLSFMANQNDGRLLSLSAKTKIIPLTQTVKGADNVAMQFINDYGSTFGLDNASAQVVKDKSETDKQGYVHLRYQRVYNNVPVYASAFLIHENKSGQVKSATGNILPITNLDTAPSLSNDQAKAKAVEIGASLLKMADPEAEQGTLYVYNKKYVDDNAADQNYLAYEVAVHDLSNSAMRKVLFINAKDGSLIDGYEGVVFALNRRIYFCNNEDSIDKCLDNTSNAKYKGRFEGDNEVLFTEVNTNYDSVKRAYDYYKNKFGIDGANNLGGIIDKRAQPDLISYSPVYTFFKITTDLKGGGPAYYIPVSGIYTGVGLDSFGPTRQDVISHEYTHAVVDNQGPNELSNYGESLVINEAYAEIFTIFIKKLYRVGDMVWTAQGYNYANPSGDKPLTHNSSNWGCKIADRYNNLTVLAHLAYLMSEGGELNGTTITGVGEDTVEDLFFITLKYLPDNANFLDFYTAMNNACYATYTSDTCFDIDNAMRAAELNRSSLCPPPKSDEYYCKYFGYECGLGAVEDEYGIRNLRCGTNKDAFNYPYDCPTGKKCVVNKCIKCSSLSDKDACISKDANCGEINFYDSCTMKPRTINCDIRKKETCPSGWGCDNANHCKPPEKILSAGGFYNLNGQYDPNGGYYLTVNIKDTWLLKNNYNSGIFQKKSDTPNVASKVCNGDDEKNCPKYGGLYTWWQAMNLPAECATKDCSAQIKTPHRGICPAGFHIPTAKEVDTVVNSLALPGQSCNANRSNQYDCLNAGAKMQWTGKDDFEAYLFNGQPASFVTADQSSATNAWTYAIQKHSDPIGPNDKTGTDSMLTVNSSDGVGRMNKSKNSLASVRCFLDCTPKDGTWSDWKPYGDCGEVGAGKQGYYRTCDAACGGAPCVGDNYKVETCDPKTSCSGLLKAAGGTLDIYGRVATGGEDSQPGYYATVKLNGKCWMASDLWTSEAKWYLAANRYDWETATKQSYHSQEIPLTLISDAMTQKSPVGSTAVRGVCPVGWAIPSNDDVAKLTDNDLPALGYTGHNTVEFWTSQGFVRAENTDQNGVYLQSVGKLHGAVLLYGYFFGGRNGYYEWNLTKLNTNLGWSHYAELKPVRCIKKDSCGTTAWKDWQKSGICGQEKPLMQKYVRTCGDIMPACCQGDASKYERCGEPANCGVVKYEGGPYAANGVTRDQGGNYRSVIIGTQCWLRDNLNIGLPIPDMKKADGYNQWIPNYQGNDALIEKYCHSENTEHCKTYGGLYQWHEAMQLPLACDSASDYQNSRCIVPAGPRQGICPAGWHLPTIAEWNVLEKFLANAASDCYVSRQSDAIAQIITNRNCEDTGKLLRDLDLSGFDAKLSSSLAYLEKGNNGYYFVNGLVGSGSAYANFRLDKVISSYWSSDNVYDYAWDEAKESGYSNPPGANYAYGRRLMSKETGIYQLLDPKTSAMSVRCIKDSKCTGPDKGWDDPNKGITVGGVSADYLNTIQSIRQALESYRNAHGYYPADTTALGKNYNITFFYQPSSYTMAQSYTLTYILPEAFCGLSAVSYRATPASLGLTKNITGATIPNTQVAPQPPATPPIVILTEAQIQQQLQQLTDLVNKASIGKPYTQEQLKFISNPRAYLLQYGYTAAAQMLAR